MKLSQEKFINGMWYRFGFENHRPVSTPIVTNQVTNRECKNRENDEKNSLIVTNRIYREAVCSLLDLANTTRPDIAFAVNVLSRHKVNSTDN